MKAAWPRWLAAVLLSSAVVALAVGAGLGLAAGALAAALEYVPVLLAFGVVGWLVASRRARNPIGWLFLVQALSFAVAAATANYARLAAATGPHLPAVGWVAWLGSLPGELFYLLPLTLLMFPDGRLPSVRWRSLAAVIIAAEALLVLLAALSGAGLRAQGSAVSAPVHLIPAAAAYSVLQVVQTALIPLTMLAAAGCAVRYRRSSADVRHQIKWFAYAGLLAAAGLFAFGVTLNNPLIAFVTVGPLIPVATGVAIMKYRLYDIDVIIRRTIVYAALAAFITAVYVAVVVGLGSLGSGRLTGAGPRPSLGLSILATAIIAVAFQPVRERVERLAGRLVYGRRATPYQAISELGGRLAGGYASDEVLPTMARTVAEGTGAERAVVWLAANSALHCGAIWPDSAPVPDPVPLSSGGAPAITGASRVLLVRHEGEVLGALSVAKRAGEAPTPLEDKLLADLSEQAGLILRNVGLNEQLLARLAELRASRLRIVQAEDTERRRIERDLHDGAQHQLLQILAKLELAGSLAGRDEQRERQLVAELRAQTRGALTTLRELAHGINPPVLSGSGLAAAVGALAVRSTPPAALTADGLRRYPADVETAVYFCCAEALQNAARHAPGAAVTLVLAESDGQLSFSAVDDGPGFDVSAAPAGTGLQNMRDRLSVLGGRLEVHAPPGLGATVSGFIPVVAGADEGPAVASGLPLAAVPAPA